MIKNTFFSSLFSPANQHLWLYAGLLSLIALIYLPFLGHNPLIFEEPRRALVARNMLETGNFLIPQLLGEIYLAKPPLYNWFIALFSLPFNEINAFSARLTSVVALGILVITFLIGLRSYLPFISLCFLGTAIILNPSIMTKADLAEIEITFMLFVTLSIWSWFWNYDKGLRGIRLWILPCFLVALAFFTKREPALLFFYFTIIPFLIFKREWRELFTLGHLLGIFIILFLILGWTGIIIYQAGLDNWLFSLYSEIANRGLSTTFSEYVNQLSYPIKLMIALLPCSFLMILLAWKAMRQDLQKTYGDLYWFVVIAILANLPLYILRESAIRYFMPMFPTLLLLATLIFTRLYTHLTDFPSIFYKIIQWSLRILISLLAVLTILICIGGIIPYFIENPEPPLLPFSFTLLLMFFSISTSIYFVRKIKKPTFILILPLFIITLLSVRSFYFIVLLPHEAAKLAATRHVPSIVQTVEKYLENKDTVVQVIDWVAYDFWFYAPPKRFLPLQRHYEKLHSGYLLVYRNHSHFLQEPRYQWELLAEMPFGDEETILFGKLTIMPSKP